MSRIRFAVVSEPSDDDEECEDVGVAFVSVPDILRTGKDVVGAEIPSMCVFAPFLHFSTVLKNLYS